MKFYGKLACAVAIIGLAGTANAQVFSFTFNNLDSEINPGASGGTRFNTAVTGIDASKSYYVSVSLNIEGFPTAYNGDYYATLLRGSDYKNAVLLNRVGKSDSLLNGYSDNGMNITLDDRASTDIHSYQDAVGSQSPLTGTFKSDARTTDPNVVLNTDARNANSSLTTFMNGTQNGTWQLMISDMNDGYSGKLVSATLTFTVVPEPATVGLASALGLIGFAAYRRMRAKAA